MYKINPVKELRESNGWTPGMFCKKLNDIIDNSEFQQTHENLLKNYDENVNLRNDYITRWENNGRFPEDPVIRQAICNLANKTIGQLLIPNENEARSLLVVAFRSSKSQREIDYIKDLNNSGLIKINLFEDSIPKLVAYIAEAVSIQNNLLISEVDLEAVLDSEIDMAKLLSTMQNSCQVTTSTTNRLLINATISACRDILKQLVPFFKN